MDDYNGDDEGDEDEDWWRYDVYSETGRDEVMHVGMNGLRFSEKINNSND